MKYIVCKKAGEVKAIEVEETLKVLCVFTFVPFSYVLSVIIRIKCEYPISLADATTITTAKVLGLKALFRREKELEPFKAELNVVLTDELPGL